MKRIAALLCLLLIQPHPAQADWVRATGSYMFAPTMPEAEACQQAESRARADAVRRVTGETLSSDEAMRCADQGDEADCVRNATVWTLLGGEIRAIRNKQSHTMPVAEAENARQCVVSFDADVRMADGKPDPNFDIGVSVNNAVLRDGETLVITLKPSQAMAVQIFQWLPYEKGDAQIARIFPNAFDRMTVIAPRSDNQDVTIPSAEGGQHYDLTVTFPTLLPIGAKMADEYLMVVATRKPLALRDHYSFDDFNHILSEIPLGDRRIVRRAYNIVRGQE